MDVDLVLVAGRARGLFFFFFFFEREEEERSERSKKKKLSFFFSLSLSFPLSKIGLTTTITVTGRDPALQGENGSCLDGSHVTLTQMPHPSLLADEPSSSTELGGSATAFQAGKSPRLMLP